MHLTLLVVALVLAPLHAEAASDSPDVPRIRAVDPRLAQMLRFGSSKSASFKAIVDRVEESDVIVHVEPRVPDHRGARGTLRFVTRAGGFRYLRITITTSSSLQATVALLGHELEHAAEVAADASVVDQESFERMYRRIGDRCTIEGPTRRYDTRAAREAGDRIFAELHARGRKAAD